MTAPITREHITEALRRLFVQPLTEPSRGFTASAQLPENRKLTIRILPEHEGVLLPSDTLSEVHVSINLCNTSGEDSLYVTDRDGTIARFDNAHGAAHVHSGTLIAADEPDDPAVLDAGAAFLADRLFSALRKRA